MYTDPSGEIIHLIIGAVAGGIINWALNGAQFNARGLGHFGVGALAGALGAGVGAGVSSALAGGSFGAGFMGTAAAKVATTSFFTGAAIGASGGFAGGFASGFGNGVIDGQSFGAALGSGLKTGAFGAASGGVIGGLYGGIDAALDGRRFFDGATVVRETATPGYTIPNVQQQLDASCSAGCASSVDQSFGGSLTETDIMKLIPKYDYVSTGVEDFHFWDQFAKATGRHSIPTNNITPEMFYSNFSKNIGNSGRFALSTNNHSVVLQSVTKSTITKISGNIITRYTYNVMDPAYGAIRSLNPSKVINIFNIR